MEFSRSLDGADCADEICPDLSRWEFMERIPPRAKHPTNPERIWLLRLKGGQQFFYLTQQEYKVIEHFKGERTIREVQQICKEDDPTIPDTFVERLVKILRVLGVLHHVQRPLAKGQFLKPGIQFYPHSNGTNLYWTLRDPTNVTQPVQVRDCEKWLIEAWDRLPKDFINPSGSTKLKDRTQIAYQYFGFDVTELDVLRNNLVQVGVVPGWSKPLAPSAPLRANLWQSLWQVLALTHPLIKDPEPWLRTCMQVLGWIWTGPFAIALTFFLGLSAFMGIHHHDHLLAQFTQIWQAASPVTLISFVSLSALVVVLHELAHALTLHQLGASRGLKVAEIGVRLMFLVPTFYTDTTDANHLDRPDHALVVAAGVLCQLVMGAIGFWLWLWSPRGSPVEWFACLLVVAALFTVLLNLNPLTRFDGYYFLCAITGFRNLRTRSWQLCLRWLRAQPLEETWKSRIFLFSYALFSSIYLLIVIAAFLWFLIQAPMKVAFFIAIWMIYYLFPRSLFKRSHLPA